MPYEQKPLNRRAFLARAGAATGAVLASSLLIPGAVRRLEADMSDAATDTIPRLEKSKAEWRRLLPDDAYEVLFEEHTEPPRTSPLNAEKRRGTFLCAACFLPLFRSDDKFESGTGWPSFTQPIPGRIGTKRDFRMIIPRTEYHCVRCGGHQGHVFRDGPPPTGQRWCNNGVALRFVPEGESLPPLRT